jgi:hypothetical protein
MPCLTPFPDLTATPPHPISQFENSVLHDMQSSCFISPNTLIHRVCPSFQPHPSADGDYVPNCPPALCGAGRTAFCRKPTGPGTAGSATQCALPRCVLRGCFCLHCHCTFCGALPAVDGSVGDHNATLACATSSLQRTLCYTPSNASRQKPKTLPDGGQRTLKNLHTVMREEYVEITDSVFGLLHAFVRPKPFHNTSKIVVYPPRLCYTNNEPLSSFLPTCPFRHRHHMPDVLNIQRMPFPPEHSALQAPPSRYEYSLAR